MKFSSCFTRKVVPLLLLLAAGLAAVFSGQDETQSAPTLAFPTAQAAPTAAAPLLRFAKPAIAQAVQSALGFALERESVQENNGISYVEFPAVSSGELVTITLTTPGEPVVDALVSYLPTRTGVIELPIPFGFSQSGRYYFLDASLSAAQAGQIERDQALSAMSERFPRGQALNLTIFKYVGLSGIDWESCTERELDPRFATACRLGAAYNRQYPDQERLLISRIPNEGEWLPIGWWFSPYFEDRQVTLP